MTEGASHSRRLAASLVVSWLLFSSAAVVIVIAAPAPPATVAASRVAITALAWAFIARLRGSGLGLAGLDGRTRWRIWISGALLGAHFSLWILSLTLTSVAHGAVLVGLQTLFAGLFGLALGDRVSWRLVAGVAVALLGTAILTGSDAGTATLLGDGLAVLAGACSAAYLVVNRGVGHALPLPVLLAWVNAVAALTIAGWILLSAGEIWVPDAGTAEVLAILWLGLGPGLLGHGSMNWAARSLPVHVVSLTVLLEPAGAAALAWLALGQPFGWEEVVGAALLLVGAGVSASDQGRGAPPDERSA
ncbi:MAG: DMT family transporter [Planctomycetota bacterium]|nr:DMT family transporter [Planctomycetota bacterium]MDG1984934.1 DMT family transporter [Planctomycetota bacterium]